MLAAEALPVLEARNAALWAEAEAAGQPLFVEKPGTLTRHLRHLFDVWQRAEPATVAQAAG